MANIVLFNHAQGLTLGLRSFADALRDAGHVVHTPDLYDGKTFPTVIEGVQHARSLGFTNILERGVGVAEGLPSDLVYCGFSLGVMPAQRLRRPAQAPRARSCSAPHFRFPSLVARGRPACRSRCT